MYKKKKKVKAENVPPPPPPLLKIFILHGAAFWFAEMHLTDNIDIFYANLVQSCRVAWCRRLIRNLCLWTPDLPGKSFAGTSGCLMRTHFDLNTKNLALKEKKRKETQHWLGISSLAPKLGGLVWQIDKFIEGNWFVTLLHGKLLNYTKYGNSYRYVTVGAFNTCGNMAVVLNKILIHMLWKYNRKF